LYDTAHRWEQQAYSGPVYQTSMQRLLRFAADRLGRDELANRLKATEEDLLKWIEGGAVMPSRQALALADLIEHLDGAKPR